MDTLPNELIIVIFNFIEKITDKRQFLKTCKLYNNLLKEPIICAENDFISNYDNHENYFFPNYEKYCIDKFTLELCYEKYFDMIPKLYFNKNYNQLMILLVKYGQLDLLKFAIDNGCELNFNTCQIAAYHGHLNILIWAKEHGYELNRNTCTFAAGNGHLDIIKWAKANGCKWDATTCEMAATNGHLKCLKWIKKNGCEWDSWTCRMAAANGHLDCLKWARKYRCPWDEYTHLCAERNGHLEVLNWALENGCPI